MSVTDMQAVEGDGPNRESALPACTTTVVINRPERGRLELLRGVGKEADITSCSAERAMSRVRIVKNRLRTTVKDDWFSSLMILSAERDILDRIRVDDIINGFAKASDKLTSMLI